MSTVCLNSKHIIGTQDTSFLPVLPNMLFLIFRFLGCFIWGWYLGMGCLYVCVVFCFNKAGYRHQKFENHNSMKCVIAYQIQG